MDNKEVWLQNCYNIIRIIDATGKITSNQQREFIKLYTQVTNKKMEKTGCGPCIRSNYKLFTDLVQKIANEI